MRSNFSKRYLLIFCVTVTGLYAGGVFAGWADAQPQGSYNKQKFGDFPPLDIDQQLQENLAAQERRLEIQPQEKKQPQPKQQLQPESQLQQNSQVQDKTDAAPVTDHPSAPLPDQNSLTPGYADPNWNRNSGLHGKKPRKKHKSGFNFPWSDKGSGFSVPWNNRRSSFNFPWDRGSSFSGPWDKDGSSFSFPWDNDPDFNPWDRDNRRDH